MIICPSCGAESSPGQRFCGQCGTALARVCPACGTENPPDHRFCGSCGTALAQGASPATGAGSVSAPSREPVAERRLVSVLFADLVGFTTLSEHRDPEEVRELLSGYFDRSRALIERYGGTVEKFIGDAVMAVWGTPVAREDDPERAVRAALALTQEVTALGDEVGMPELRVRAGVLTGNAAVDVAAEGEGMVLGDTVNTASRLQSIADPGTVLVDDVTRRASEAAIAYEDAGTHEVKGREQPVRAWTALRVVAGAGGARRGSGLEAPFVGRQRELQSVIEAGEESAHDGRARHVAVAGEAGAGKSRLLWEFFKYLDGIEEGRYWHQGRCLSYGEGVAYWALAEMVRGRARIQEEEDPTTARQKLRSAVEEFVPDERERRLVEPRLAHLLRLEERPDADRADLFSGWRLFFERMATDAPVVLAFEDLQWADSGLLDFIDYLLEWSAEYPIFVLTLARPELQARRPSWTAVNLESLEIEDIARMLEGLAPGLPDELVAQIARRAEGIPLYAVETIRMLQDRGLLVQEGVRYVVTGEVSDLEVPETLHALVASRLDGLSAAERSLLQDASVLGQVFTAAAAAALSSLAEGTVVDLLDGLVAKQILARDDDPRSPERGQYAFLQGLVRTVAYGMLSRRARKSLHVAAALHLEKTWPGELRDIAEVLASHYQEAIAAEPEADDVAALRASARERLTAAGQAAASLALGPEAERYFEEAAELAEDDLERAELLQRAGRALWVSGDTDAAERRLHQAIELYAKGGRPSGGAAAVLLGFLLRNLGRVEEARAVLEPFRQPDVETDQIVRAEGLAELAAVSILSGSVEEAGPVLEDALLTLEQQQAWPQLANALITRAIFLIFQHRSQEAEGVLRHALALGERDELPAIVLRARYNLASLSLEADRFAEAIHEVEQALTLARERGDRSHERRLLGQIMVPLYVLGRWNEAVTTGAVLIEGASDADAVFAASVVAPIAAARGDDAMLERCRTIAADLRDSTYADQRVSAEIVFAREALEQGIPAEALQLSRAATEQRGVASEGVEEAYALASEAAIRLSDDVAVQDLIELVSRRPPASMTPLLRAGRARLQAEAAHRRGEAESARRHEDEALELLRSLGAHPLLARTLLERARRRPEPEALAEARSIYAELGATRWLERIGETSEVAA
ncbi:MAG: adenylate/guanylate cyclase domain-containing protein [Solirubrobacteraceae bacterium]